MDEREISGRLPAPRHGEPPSLRQDIIDELADHLRCSMRRELLATGNEQLARQRVVDKFGDPAEVARRLWFQAMWSKIMSQRLMLATIGLLTALCILLVGFNAWLIQRQRLVTVQEQQVLAEMMERMARWQESAAQSVN